MNGLSIDNSMWTTTRPSLDGYYWWRFSESDRCPDIVQLHQDNIYYFQIREFDGERIYSVRECGGEFIGPIILQHTTIDKDETKKE